MDLSHSPLVFVLPAESDAPSGGNVYNRNLVQALGDVVRVQTTNFAEAEGMLKAGRPGTYLFDTLDLARTATLPAVGPLQYIGLVVHHLPSLEPDLEPDDRSIRAEFAALARFDALIVTSEFTRGWLSRPGGPDVPIIVVPPALRPWPDTPRTYLGPVCALMVANMIPRKGILPLIHALAAQGPAPYSLRVVGRMDVDPPYTDACRRAVGSTDWIARQVSLEGPVPHERVGDLHEASNLFVSAARMETFGMAVQEARAHGLPILAVDGGHVRHHFIDGDNGRLSPSVGDLARTFVALANDPVGMSQIFSRAQLLRTRRDYTWPVAAAGLMDELARVRLPGHGG